MRSQKTAARAKTAELWNAEKAKRYRRGKGTSAQNGLRRPEFVLYEPTRAPHVVPPPGYLVRHRCDDKGCGTQGHHEFGSRDENLQKDPDFVANGCGSHLL